MQFWWIATLVDCMDCGSGAGSRMMKAVLMMKVRLPLRQREAREIVGGCERTPDQTVRYPLSLHPDETKTLPDKTTEQPP